MTDVRSRLTARLASLLATDAALASRLRAPLEADSEEQAAHLALDDALASLSDAARTEAVAVRDALRRWDAGTYGRCVRCGVAIAPARLDALPEAATCVTCA